MILVNNIKLILEQYILRPNNKMASSEKRMKEFIISHPHGIDEKCKDFKHSPSFSNDQSVRSNARQASTQWWNQELMDLSFATSGVGSQSNATSLQEVYNACIFHFSQNARYTCQECIHHSAMSWVSTTRCPPSSGKICEEVNLQLQNCKKLQLLVKKKQDSSTKSSILTNF